MDLDPRTLSARERYALLIQTIVPRPIAWVSTIGAQGALNLAPFSFFTGIAAEPMSVCFAPVNNRHGAEKDTLVNIRQTGEFVVNSVSEENAARMNETSAEYPHGVSEFEKAGLTPVPSAAVKPPRVKESPIQMECRLLQIVTLSSGPLGGHLVIGEVVHFHAAEPPWDGRAIGREKFKAVGRMGGAWYARTGDCFEMKRPEALR